MNADERRYFSGGLGGEEVGAELLALGGGHGSGFAGAGTGDFGGGGFRGAWSWWECMNRGCVCRGGISEDEFAADVIDGPVEADAEDAAVGGNFVAVDAVDFGQESGAGGEAVGEGIGFGEVLEGGQFIDGENAHAAEAGGEADRTGAEHGAGPEAHGLAFFTFADQLHEMAFEEEHGGEFRVSRHSFQERRFDDDKLATNEHE